MENPPTGMSATKSKKYEKPAYLKQLNAEERLRNEKIIQNMSKRINYLKNPKFATTGKPPDTNTQTLGAISDKANPFRVEPSILKFADYQASGLYEIPLKITNNSPVLQRLKWVPPQTPHFSVSGVKWPSEETHQVAAGMSVVLKVNFLAPSFADYDDQLILITQDSSYPVPIVARREPPVISLSNPMDCGACWLGDRTTITFRCQNKGGEGMFRFFTEYQHQQRAAAAEAAERRQEMKEAAAMEGGMDFMEDEEEAMEEHGDYLRTEPFTIYPAQFYLHSGSIIDIMVAFIPHEEGAIEQNIVLACDNQTSQVFQLKGTVSMLSMRLHSLDGKLLEDPIPAQETAVLPISKPTEGSLDATSRSMDLTAASNQALSDLFFPNTNPTATSERRLVIKNTSAQTISFHWSVYREKNAKKLSLDDESTHFTIEPAQGKFTANEEREFVFSFSPQHAEPYYEYADLIVEDIPLSSLHDPPPGLRAIHSSSGSLMGPPGPTHVASNTRFPSVPLFQFSLCGQGNLCALEVQPPVLNFPGETYHSQPARQALVIQKKSQGIVNFEIKLAKRTHKALGVALLHNGAEVLTDSSGPFKGHFSASDQKMELEVQFESRGAVGRMGAYFYVHVQDGGPETFQAWGEFVGPRVTIVEPEINFGLMKINDKQRFRLHLKNTAPVPCQVALKRIEDAELTFQTIRAAHLSGDMPDAAMSAEASRAATELQEHSAGHSKSTVSFQEFEVVYHPNGSVSAITDLTARDEQALDQLLARQVPNAVLFDPPFLELGGNEEKSILLTLQTNSPETIDSLVEVLVGGGGDDRVQASHVALKAEIQKPEVDLSRMELKLGTQFAGMPVRVDPYSDTSVVMRNTGHIPVQFHWQERSDPHFADIVFEPAKGVIAPHCELEVAIGVTFYTGGDITQLLLCEVEDLDLPLAIEMSATVMGLSVVYERVDEKAPGPNKLRRTGRDQSNATMSHTAMMRSLRSSRGLETKASRFSRLHSTQQEINKEALRLRRIDFINCEINKPATQRFVIRNESGIPTAFQLRPQFYTPAPIAGAGAGQQNIPPREAAASQDFSEEQGTTKGSIVSSRAGLPVKKKTLRFAPSARGTKKGQEAPKRLNRVILSDAHQQTQKFQSASGETFTHTKRLEGEQQHYLANNKGLAIVCQPESGELPPHGEMLIKVTAFNNVCGRFEDILVSQVEGLPVQRFPLKVLVTGTPVQIPPNQVGLNYTDVPPTLAFPPSMADSVPGARTFRIQNKGIQDLRLEWRIFDLKKPGLDQEALEQQSSRENALFAIDLVPNEEATPEMEALEPFKLDFKAIEPPPATDSAFAISPPSAVIESKGSTSFQVKFDGKKGMGFFQSTILAHPHLVDEGAGSRRMSLEDEAKKEASAKTFLDLEQGSVTTTQSAMLKDLGFVALYATGSTLQPKLSVDKHVTSGGEQVVKFKSWSLQHDSAPKLVRKITLTNNTLAELQFNLSVEGPFRLVKTKTNAAEKLAKEKLPPRPNSGLGRVGTKGPPPETMFLLQPATIVEAHVALLPPKVSSLEEWPMREQAVHGGVLRVTYANSTEQAVKLKGVLLRPKITVQAERARKNEKAEMELNFGTTHIEHPKRQTLYLSNVTEVLANWSLHYIKFPKKDTLGHRTVTMLEQENIDKTDDPEVFEFFQSSGYLHGPSVPLKLTPDGFVLKNPLADRGTNDKELMPMKLLVNFRPKANVLYKSKFRFMVEDGIPCDITLKGTGSYEEEND